MSCQTASTPPSILPSPEQLHPTPAPAQEQKVVLYKWHEAFIEQGLFQLVIAVCQSLLEPFSFYHSLTVTGRQRTETSGLSPIYHGFTEPSASAAKPTKCVLAGLAGPWVMSLGQPPVF